jgi:polyisoprenoid-binding protein YceI
MKLWFFFGCLVFPSLSWAQAPQKVDPSKSYIRFVSKQMGVPVEGRFRTVGGTVTFDPAKPEGAKADIEVALASIDLGDAESETEVKRPLWFDTARFPSARFTLSALKPAGGNKYDASGTLEMKGLSKPIAAPVALAESGGQRTIEGQFTMKRLQFRIGEGQWSDTETVADDVLVRFRFVIPAR